MEALASTTGRMVRIPCTTAIVRFPRRCPLIFLVVLIPFSALLYTYFGELHAWASNTIVPINPGIHPAIPSSTDSDFSNATTAGNILLVSAFFPLSKSKHSIVQYSAWLSRFLGQISTDVYFFTTPDLAPTIRQIRGSLPITINTTYASAFDIPPLHGREEDYVKMHEWDREKDHHSPELYAIWAAKPFLLAEALRTVAVATPDTVYKYAFWSDAGSFRQQHAFKEWPGLERVEQIWSMGKRESGSKTENLIFFPIQHLPDVSMLLWKENMGPIDNDFSEGNELLPPFYLLYIEK